MWASCWEWTAVNTTRNRHKKKTPLHIPLQSFTCFCFFFLVLNRVGFISSSPSLVIWKTLPAESQTPVKVSPVVVLTVRGRLHELKGIQINSGYVRTDYCSVVLCYSRQQRLQPSLIAFTCPNTHTQFIKSQHAAAHLQIKKLNKERSSATSFTSFSRRRRKVIVVFIWGCVCVCALARGRGRQKYMLTNSARPERWGCRRWQQRRRAVERWWGLSSLAGGRLVRCWAALNSRPAHPLRYLEKN